LSACFREEKRFLLNNTSGQDTTLYLIYVALCIFGTYMSQGMLKIYALVC